LQRRCLLTTGRNSRLEKPAQSNLKILTVRLTPDMRAEAAIISKAEEATLEEAATKEEREKALRRELHSNLDVKDKSQ